MSISAFLTTLIAKGIEVWAEGDRLRVRGPQQALTPTMMDELKVRKADVLEHLRANPQAVPGLALSNAQQAIWNAYRAAPESAAYNVNGVLALRSDYDHDALERALSTVADRHLSLRCRFRIGEDGAPAQYADPRPAVALKRLRVDGDVAMLEAAIDAEIDRPFRLEHDLPLRCSVFQSAHDASARMVFVIHHIAVDFWAAGIFVAELIEAYTAQVERRAALLPTPEFDLRAFVGQERERLLQPEVEAEYAYLGRLLEDEEASLRLPADRARPRTRSYCGRSFEIALAPELVVALRALARQQQVTPYIALLAVYSLLLSRVGRCRSVRLGVPTSGRYLPGSEDLVANMVNLMPYVAEIDVQTNYVDLLADSRRRLGEVLARQHLPYNELVRRFARRRDSGHSPFFDVLFNWNKVAAPKLADNAVFTKYLRGSSTGRSGATHDLALSIVESGETLSCLWTFDPASYDEATVRGYANAYVHLLTQLLANPQARLAGVDLLDRGAHQETLATLSRGPTADLTFESFPRRVAVQALRAPDAIALVDGELRITYRELNQRANRWARRLSAAGAGPEQCVVLWLERGYEFVLACLAVAKTGAAFVPLAASLPRERVSLICRDSKARLLLTDAHTGGAQQDLGADAIACLTLQQLEVEAMHQPDADLGLEPQPSSLAYIIYTSGSTGAPKGVMISHGSLAHYLAWHCQRAEISADTVTLQSGSIGFDASIIEIWPTLVSGGRVCVVPTELAAMPSRLPAFCIEHGVTWAFLIAPVFDAVAPEAWLDVLSLRGLAVGGDRVHTRLPNDRIALDNLYGPTESTVLATCGAIEPGASEELPLLGRPISNAEVLLVDGTGALVPSGSQGEMLIASPGLARGYIGDPSRTADAFRPHPFAKSAGERVYHSGDLGRYRNDGRLQFLGRIDRQLKLRGYRIEPAEIERALLAQVGVTAAKLLHLDSGNTARLVAFCTGTADVERLRDGLRRVLPVYMVPSAIEMLESLPLNSNGKIDETALATMANRCPARSVVEAKTDSEKALLPIWREVLGRDYIGIDDDFFESGGHSLTAAQVVERIRRDLGHDLPMATLLANPSVQALAAWMQADSSMLPAVAAATAMQGDLSARHMPFPLTDVQHAYWAGRAAGFDLGNTATHIYTEQALGEFDGDEVSRVWNRLIRRHDMLRAVVSVDGMQRVLAQVPDYHIEVEDLCSMDDATREQRLLATRERMSHQVFDPQHWPMFEIRVSRLAPARYRLHTSIDALIADARSFGLLEAEYDVIAQGREHELPQLELCFRDYVLAERQAREGQQYENAKSYWQSRLDRFPGPPALPLAVDPAEIDKPVFKRRAGTLDSALWQQIKERARRLRATPSALLLAAYADVLGLWSAEPRFGLNLTLFNRQPLHPQVDYLVGDFTSLTLLEVATGDGSAFAERVQRCQNQLWTDLEHRSFTGVEVLREMARRNASRAASMPVVFTSILPLEGEGGSASSTVPDYAITQTSQVWIDHVAEERGGELHYHWDSVEALFPAGLLEDMFAAYASLLSRLANDESAWQQQAPVVLPTSQLQARLAYNQTSESLPQGFIFGAFLESAARDPQAPAVITDQLSLSYGEVHTLSTSLAMQLRARGVRPNQLVAIEMRKGWEQVVAALAVTMSGAAYMPVDVSLPAARKAQLFEQGGVRLALVQASIEPMVVDGIERITVQRFAGLSEHSFVAPQELRESDLAYVIFTSGSTGVPKGVMIDHRGAVNTIADINQRFDINAHDRLLALSSLSFDLSVYDIFGMLGAGGAVVVPGEDDVRNPQQWSTYLRRHAITVFNAVPSFMQMLLDYYDSAESQDIGPLRLAMMSGDWIPVTLPKRLRDLVPDCRVISLGGATEASIWSIWHDIDRVDPAWRSIPYGRPMYNQRIHVLRPDFSPSPDWVPGALFIGGIGLAQGYWGDALKTDSSFILHPQTGERLYRTGDLGRFTACGWVEFLGRADTQVKVQGHRIELSEIETHLGQHPAVREVAVAVRGEGPGRGLYAYVVPGQALMKAQAAEESRSAVDFAPEHNADADVGTPLIDDPVDRLLFKFARHGLRRLTTATSRIALPDQPRLRVELGDCDVAQGPRTLVQLAAVLSALRAIPQAGAPLPKLHYPSAGSLYPVQVHVRIGVGSELDAGSYYFDPDAYALIRLGDCDLATPEIQIALVGDLDAIAPLYGSLALGFCALEAGYIHALLDASAKGIQLGMRPVDVDVMTLSRELNLGRGQRVLCVLGEGARGRSAAMPPERDEIWQALNGSAEHCAFDLEPLARQSYREYLPTPLPLNELADVLREAHSALTSVWLYAKAGRIAGIEAGLYRLSTDGSALTCVAAGVDAAVAESFSGDNRPLFEQAAFAILITGPDRGLMRLQEAGWVGGRIGLRAANGRIGLCGIGHLREQSLFSALPNLRGAEVLHTLVGGAIAMAQKSRWQAIAKPNAEQALSRQLDAHLRLRLPEYMAPRGYVVLDALPLNANGKIDRQALPAPGAQTQQVRSFVAPQGDLELLIADVWKELLGVDRVGRDESFFALGGNSVLIVQMFGRLSAQIAAEFSVADLFAHVTVAELAAHLQRGVAAPRNEVSDADVRAAKRRLAHGRERRPSPQSEGA